MLPSSPREQNVTEFVVALSSMTATSSSGRDVLGSSKFPISVLLDSGGAISELPSDIVDAIWTEVGAIVTENGRPVVPCRLQSNSGWFEFGFGGPGGAVINVTMGQLINNASSLGPFIAGPYKGEDACYFGIQKGQANRYILGDTFLRSAYVVYDMENLEIGMAPATFNVTSNAVIPFDSKGAVIPSSTPAPSQDAAALSAAAVTVTPTALVAAHGFQSMKSAAVSGPRSGWTAISSLLVLLSLSFILS